MPVFIDGQTAKDFPDFDPSGYDERGCDIVHALEDIAAWINGSKQWTFIRANIR